MSDVAASFARAAPGVRAATALQTGAVVHSYRGRLESVSEPVRLLVLSPDISDSLAASVFERAAAEWATISDRRGVVTVYDRGVEPRPWIAVESVDGKRLSEQNPPLPVGDVRQIVGAAAEVLRDVGRADVHHGSLTPECVWLTDGGSDVQLDCWGIERACRQVVEGHSYSPYAPPEQRGGADRTDATNDDLIDVYGLGAVAYYALTGSAPCDSSEDANGDNGSDDIAASVRSSAMADSSEVDDPVWIEDGNSRPRAGQLNTAVPSDLDAVVERAMDPDPHDRYATPYELKIAMLFDSHGDESGGVTQAVGADHSTATDRPGEPTRTDDQAPQPDGEPSPVDRTDDSGPEVGTVGGYPVSRRAALGAVGLGIVGVAGWVATGQFSTAATAGGVRMFQHDPRNTGYAPANRGPTRDAEVDWEVQTTFESLQPIVADGRIFLGGEGELRAVDASDGTTHWDDDRAERWSIPAVGEDRVFFGGVEEGTDEPRLRIHAFDTETGEHQWESRPFGLPFIGQLVLTLTDDTVYFAGSEAIYGLDADTGDERWSYDSLTDASSIQAYDDEHVYVRVSGELTAVQRGGQREEWSIEANSLWGLTVADDAVYFPRYTDQEEIIMSAVSTGAGETLWTRSMESPPRGPLAVGDGTLYAGTDDGTVHAFDTSDGSRVWEQELGTELAPPGIITDEAVYAGSLEGDLFALQPDDGRTLWETTVANTSGLPSVADGRLYVYGSDRLFALGDA